MKWELENKLPSMIEVRPTRLPPDELKRAKIIKVRGQLVKKLEWKHTDGRTHGLIALPCPLTRSITNETESRLVFGNLRE